MPERQHAPQPATVEFRNHHSEAALVFLHGFQGHASETWGRFPEFLRDDLRLESWDIFGLGYASSLRVDVPGLWSADPGLKILSRSLRTALSIPPLSRYRTIALVAHSMGGLVAQHALLDDALALRVGHLVLFGTPSGGLMKALVGGLLKKQARDMWIGSPFILGLRRAWKRKFDRRRPFVLRVVAGESDQFVPPKSSLNPFPEAVQLAIPGNHLEIVKPESASERSVQLITDLLRGESLVRDAVDSARLAVERREFASAVTTLLPRADFLDEAALVQLALALEETGRRSEALEVLERRVVNGRSGTDTLGVLGGRLKRRWLVERNEADWQRARELYAEGLQRSDPRFHESGGRELGGGPTYDPDQAMYHSINVAFLDLLIAPPASRVPRVVQAMAERARRYASDSAPGPWRSATEGDALCILGDLDGACRCYVQARGQGPSPRMVDSMYAHAIRIAHRVHGRDGEHRVQQAFGIGIP